MLIKCKACGKEVSKKAGKCPDCGHPMQSKIIKYTLIVIAILVLLYVVGKLNPPKETEVMPIENIHVIEKTPEITLYKPYFTKVVKVDYAKVAESQIKENALKDTDITNKVVSIQKLKNDVVQKVKSFNTKYGQNLKLADQSEIFDEQGKRALLWQVNEQVIFAANLTNDDNDAIDASAIVILTENDELNKLNVLLVLNYLSAYMNISPDTILSDYIKMLEGLNQDQRKMSFSHDGIEYIATLPGGSNVLFNVKMISK